MTPWLTHLSKLALLGIVFVSVQASAECTFSNATMWQSCSGLTNCVGNGQPVLWVNGVNLGVSPSQELNVNGVNYTRGAQTKNDVKDNGVVDARWQVCTDSNQPPIADDATLVIDEDIPGQVKLSSRDPDGPGPVIYQLDTVPSTSVGRTSLVDNQLTFTPAPDWNGVTIVGYRVQDSKGTWSEPAKVLITVNPVNDIPSVDDREIVTLEDVAASIILTAHDPDKGDTHTFEITASPSAEEGTATIVGNKLTFAPAQDWNGATRIQYLARDSAGAVSHVATVQVVVKPVNDVPVMTPITIKTAEDHETSVPLSAADIDSPNDFIFEVYAQVPASEGSLIVVGNTLVFKPAKDWAGTTSAKIVARDTDHQSSLPVDVLIIVTPENDAPSSRDVSITLAQGQSQSVNISVVDPDKGDTQTVSLLDPVPASFGSLSVSGLNINVSPNAKFAGKQSFRFLVKDKAGAVSTPNTLFVDVQKVNVPPSLSALSLKTQLGLPVEAMLAASDPNGDSPISYQISAALPAEAGSLSITGSKIQFSPAPGWVGISSASVIAIDPDGAVSVPVTISVEVQNDIVVAQDPDAPDSHSIVVVSQPPVNVGSIKANGLEVVFTPVVGFYGEASFTYLIRDAAGADSPVATGSILVSKYNYAPTSTSASLVAEQGLKSDPVTPTVIDPNPYDQGLHTFSVPAQSMIGFAEVINNQLVYTAPYDFEGVTQFKYNAVDEGNLAVSGIASVTVQHKNYSPTRLSLMMKTPEGVPVSGVPTVEDKNPTDPHTFSIETQPIVGTAELVGGAVQYSPPDSFFGVTTFTIRASDPSGESVVGTVWVDVLRTDKAPEALTGKITVKEGQVSEPFYPTIIDSNAYDLMRHLLSIEMNGAHGLAEVVNNRIIYTPTDRFYGQDTIQVKATDPSGLSVVGEIAVVVTQHNYSPSETNVTIYTVEGQPSNPVQPWIVDPNAWDSFTVEIIKQPSNGKVVVSGDRMVYTPNMGFTGEELFRFRVVDTGGLYVEGIGTAQVARSNSAPTDIGPDEVLMYEGVGGNALMSVADSNIWDSHRLEVVNQPEHGTVNFNGLEMDYRTDGKTPSVVRLRAIDRGGLSFEKDIRIKFRPASDIVIDRPILELGFKPVIPGVTAAMVDGNGRHSFRVLDIEAMKALGNDIVAVVQPSSSLGIRLGHRALGVGDGSRFTPDLISPTSLEEPLAAFSAGDSGKSTVLLSRMDRTGPVYAVPVSVWSLQGGLESQSWKMLQGVGRSKIEFKPSNNVCVPTTSIVAAKARNVIDAPTCYLEWATTPKEWKDRSNRDTLSLEAAGSQIMVEPVRATSFVLDQDGNKFFMASFDHDLETVSLNGSIRLGPEPAIQQVFYKVEDINFLLKQIAGPECTLTTIEQRAKITSSSWSSNVMCYVKWTQIPNGLQQRENWERPYLLNAVQEQGPQTIKWAVSIFSPTGVEITASEGEHTFNASEPASLAISMDNRRLIKGDLYSAPLSGGYLGELSIKGFNAPIKLTLNQDGQVIEDGVAPKSWMDEQNIRRRVNANAKSSLWTLSAFNAKAAFEALPATLVQQEFEILSVPDDGIKPVILNKETTVLSTDKLEIDVGIQDVYVPGNTYDVNTMGKWQVRLLAMKNYKESNPLTDWADTNGAGETSFDVPVADVAGDVLRIVAEARVVSPVPEYSSIRTGLKPLFLSVLNGDPLDGSVRALRMSGEAPLRVTLFADLDQRKENRDLGSVNWEMSTNNGGSWQPVKNPSRASQRLSMSLNKGKYLVRAQLVNKHSGATSMTQSVEIEAYNVPAVRIKGPGNVFVTGTAHYRLQNKDNTEFDPSNKKIEWSLDRGKTWEEGTGTLDITRDVQDRIYVMARARFLDSPEEPGAYRKVRGAVGFRAIRPPRVQILGRTRPEIDKPVTWTAKIYPPYINMEVEMGSEFILPTGEVVKGNTVEFTPTAEDRDRPENFLSVKSWVVDWESRGAMGTTTKRLDFWEYIWPNWFLQPTYTAEFAPAQLEMRVKFNGPFKEFEKLNYDWELPPVSGFTLVKDDYAPVRIVSIDEPGEFMFRVHISDGRGNYSVIERSIRFREPPPWNVGINWAGDNPANRAPLGIFLRPSMTGGHPRDRVTKMAYSINGELLDSGKSRYGRAKLPEAGTYQISLDIETEMGKSARKEVQVEVKENKPPVCELDVTEGFGAWTAKANCKDEDGKIVKHLWMLNDSEVGINGRIITVSKKSYASAPQIRLIGVDDSGAESEPVIW